MFGQETILVGNRNTTNPTNLKIHSTLVSIVFTLSHEGPPISTIYVRGRPWLSLPSNSVEHGRVIDVNYIQPVYEH